MAYSLQHVSYRVHLSTPSSFHICVISSIHLMTHSDNRPFTILSNNPRPRSFFYSFIIYTYFSLTTYLFYTLSTCLAVCLCKVAKFYIECHNTYIHQEFLVELIMRRRRRRGGVGASTTLSYSAFTTILHLFLSHITRNLSRCHERPHLP